ncbi:hypothetical protein [Agromyces atrinae]|uniref:LppX_LprAFG lipoprotein n=1 Tax=Agromyces atrinae TaxID=592376 RepID=A0A4Q2M8K4_9MICO|nr:hypothetical protein [Agromyces atrinae]NYD68161.1 hypothetical protein [Agromyces atrinae]RXZ87697.1 hypothetical protein ESP50_00365 [Agromyces atrinae]
MRAAAALAAVALMLGLAGCTGGSGDAAPTPSDDGPRVVTTAESELLAVIRFKNFDAGTRSVEAAFDDSGSALTLDGWFDYETHVGYGLVTADGNGGDLILWDGTTLAALSAAGATSPPLPVPASTEAWSPGAVDPTASAAQAVLSVVASLGADRPENPLLLRQNGALHLTDDEIDGTAVSVFTGPAEGAVSGDAVDPDASGVRYWVDETGLLLRVEARLGGTWVTIDLGPADDVTIPGPIPTAVPGA